MERSPSKILARWLPFRRRPEAFITDRALAGRERFQQFCAFGTTFTYETGAEAAAWFAECRREWIGSGEPAHWGRLSPTEQDAFIAELLYAILRDVLAGVDRGLPLTLGVSAGFDSRLLLHGFRRLGAIPRTHTFGQVGSLDFAVMEQLAPRLALEQQFIDTDAIPWNDEDIVRRARLTPLSARRVFDYESHGLGAERVRLHGYLGGALTGSTIPSTPSPSWKAALQFFCRSNDVFNWQGLMPAEQVRALLPTKPFLEAGTLSYDRQLDLGFRQAQRIRPGGAQSRSHVLPFEDRRWVGFWLARDVAEIGDQVLYIRFIRGLGAEEFFDLRPVSETLRTPLLQARNRMILETDGHGDPTTGDPSRKALPRNPSTPFCWFAGYANNASFRQHVEASLRRLERRAVFAPSYIAKVHLAFEKGEHRSNNMLNGLLSVDVALEAGLFD